MQISPLQTYTPCGNNPHYDLPFALKALNEMEHRMKTTVWLSMLMSLLLTTNGVMAEQASVHSPILVAEQALSTKEQVIVLTTSDHCSTCDQFAKTLIDMAPWVQDKVSFVVLNRDAFPELAEKYQLTQEGILFNLVDGEVVDFIDLDVSQETLSIWLINKIHKLPKKKRYPRSAFAGCDASTYEVIMKEYTEASRDALFAEVQALVAEQTALDIDIRGDAQNGEFTAKIPLLGRMEGTFRVQMPYERLDYDPNANQGALLILQVAYKPFFISCGLIKSTVDENIAAVGKKLGVEIKRLPASSSF